MIVVQYILKLIKENMQNAQKRAKFYANINQNPNFFEIIHKMLLKIKLVKNYLRLRKCPKLPPSYCGPFAILRKKKGGKMAYQLGLPKKWKIQDVFHVSVLKKRV
jgi:hypothetical protein